MKASSKLKRRGGPARAIRQAAILCSWLIVATGLAAQAEAPPAASATQGELEVSAFKEAVRKVVISQERIVRGDVKAAALLTDQMREVAGLARDLPLKAWEAAEARLLLLQYTLSGGEPALMRQIAERKLVPEAEKPIYLGTLAYVEGHQKSARTWFAQADLANLPRAVVARVLLARAVLLKRESPNEARELCTQAWAISAGTYAEEIATRLLTQLSADTGDVVAFRRHFYRYARRFPRSPYMATVVPAISKMLIKEGYGEDTPHSAEMAAFLERLPAVRRYEILRAIALNSIRDGRPQIAAAAATQGLRLPDLQSLQTSELQVFLGAALTVTGDLKSAKNALDAAEKHGVKADLRGLVMAIRALGQQIGRPIPRVELLTVASNGNRKATQAEGMLTPGIRSRPTSAEHEVRIADAKSRLASADHVLKEASE